MTESVATSSDADAAAARASEQARLRRERREAKIKAGGSARLNKINGMGGRVVGETTFIPPAPEATPAAASPAAPAPAPSASVTTHSADPDEVDISQHFYQPGPGARPAEPSISEAQLRQMMLGLDRPQPTGPQGFPGAEAFGAGGETDDPIMKMMAQMMGAGGPGGPGGQSPFPGMPPFPGMSGMPGMPGMPQQQQAPADPYTYIWRLLHALLALGLGLYIIVLTPFSGTKVEREREAISSDPLADEMQHHKQLFFWIFATGETLLLTSRLFLDSSRPAPAGMLWSVVGFLPEPFKGYVTVALRYFQIFSTVRSDILACIFVLGACSWWRG